MGWGRMTRGELVGRQIGSTLLDLKFEERARRHRPSNTFNALELLNNKWPIDPCRSSP